MNKIGHEAAIIPQLNKISFKGANTDDGYSSEITDKSKGYSAKFSPALKVAALAGMAATTGSLTACSQKIEIPTPVNALGELTPQESNGFLGIGKHSFVIFPSGLKVQYKANKAKCSIEEDEKTGKETYVIIGNDIKIKQANLGKGKGTRNVNLKLTGNKIKMDAEVNSITANISKSRLAAYNTVEVTGSENDITASKAIINGNKNDIRASKIDLKGNENTIIDTNHRSTASHIDMIPITQTHTGPNGETYFTTTYMPTTVHDSTTLELDAIPSMGNADGVKHEDLREIKYQVKNNIKYSGSGNKFLVP